jgi:hypothetical protein
MDEQDDNPLKILNIFKKTDGDDDSTEPIDVDKVVSDFLNEMRMLYLDLFADQDELDPEVIKVSYQLQKALKFAILNGGHQSPTIVAMYFKNFYNNDKTPYDTEWYDLLSDDDMQINAYQIMQAVCYSVCVHSLECSDEEE